MTTPARLRRFIADPAGATAIEYGLIAALIAVAAVSGFTNFGNGIQSMWNYIDTNVRN